jgi:SAM-dependent methyltransferase
VWAVDQEQDMVRVGRTKAGGAGATNVRWIVSRAERLAAPDGWFDLATVGNAFHRLSRRAVADLLHRWVRPGGHVALLWSGSPWRGDAAWQAALRRVSDRWKERTWADRRIPPGWERQRAEEPDAEILGRAGFSLVLAEQRSMPHAWTADTLIGFVHSTSFLSRSVLGGRAEEFGADLRAALRSCSASSVFHQDIDCAFELFVRGPAVG